MLDFGAGETIRLEAIFEAASADHLTETPLAADQTITRIDDSHVRLEAAVLDTPQLRWWLLGFGDNVEVVAPEGLRHEFAAVTVAMAAAYSKAG